MIDLTISYQSLLLPPPYAYAYTLSLKESGTSLEVIFELEYLNRESISKDEILNEGFTERDDYSWQGKLGAPWIKQAQKLMDGTHLIASNNDENTWIHIQSASGQGHPKSIEDWDYFLQELIQAIYEVSGQERPLYLELLEVKEGKPTSFILEGFFKDRTSSLNNQKIQWDQMQNLVKSVFELEPDTEGTEKINADGLWVDPTGDQVYYFLGKQGEKAIDRLISDIRKTQ